MKESKVKNVQSMFQQIENHMKNILGEKESTKQYSSQDFGENFIRTGEVRKAYGMFENQFKLSLAKAELQKSAEPRNQLK